MGARTRLDPFRPWGLSFQWLKLGVRMARSGSESWARAGTVAARRSRSRAVCHDLSRAILYESL